MPVVWARPGAVSKGWVLCHMVEPETRTFTSEIFGDIMQVTADAAGITIRQRKGTTSLLWSQIRGLGLVVTRDRLKHDILCVAHVVEGASEPKVAEIRVVRGDPDSNLFLDLLRRHPLWRGEDTSAIAMRTTLGTSNARALGVGAALVVGAVLFLVLFVAVLLVLAVIAL